jgi:hypothetical protein
MMLKDSRFWWGVAAGVIGTWAFHAFAKPLPRGNGG